MKKTAFTLAEVLVVMAILGFLAIIILPNTRTLIPNNSMTMFKKAYAVTGQVVNALIEDEDLYPDTYDDDDNLVEGFKNTDEATYKSAKRSGNSKFCYLFAEMLNTVTDLDCKDEDKAFTAGEAPQGHFTTSDGIVWIMPIVDFSVENQQYPIYIDINGDEKPNCFSTDAACNCESATTNADGSKYCSDPEPDRMIMYVTYDGKLSLPDTSVSGAENFYIKSEKTSSKYHTRNTNQ